MFLPVYLTFCISIFNYNFKLQPEKYNFNSDSEISHTLIELMNFMAYR